MIQFSDTYEDLFRLLSCWDELKKDPDNKYLQKLSKVDTVLLSGGRDSGKSFGIGCFQVIAAADYNHRVLSTRYTMSSTDNSISAAIKNRAEDLNKHVEFDFQSKEFYHKHSNGKITITGQKTSSGNQTAKLKSLEDYSIFITDEAEELLEFEEWNKVKRSIRAKDVQALNILVFNPPTKEHWIAKKFYLNIPDGFCGIIDNVLYIHTTYLDNGKENMAEHIWREYQILRKDYEAYESLTTKQRESAPTSLKYNWEDYKFRILGGFKKQAEGVIYDRVVIEPFPDEQLDAHGFGLDFGSNDPDALTEIKADYSRKRIYIRLLYCKNNTSTDDLFTVLKDRCGYYSRIVGDSAERRLIRDFLKRGLNIVKADKRLPVATQIKHLKGWEIVADIDSTDFLVGDAGKEKNYNLINCFNNYSWHDKRAGIIKHEYSDPMDSWRYIAIDLLNIK